jgi:hypothetical protein
MFEESTMRIARGLELVPPEALRSGGRLDCVSTEDSLRTSAALGHPLRRQRPRQRHRRQQPFRQERHRHPDREREPVFGVHSRERGDDDNTTPSVTASNATNRVRWSSSRSSVDSSTRRSFA